MEESRLRQPPEEVAPEHALRQRLLPRTDREHDLVRRRELLRDLEARVSATHHEDRARRNVAPAVDNRRRASGRRRRSSFSASFGTYGTWNGPVATTTWSAVIVRPSTSRRKRPSSSRSSLVDLAVQFDRQLEGLRVALEVRDHLVSGRVAVGIAGEGKPWQRAVAPGREERRATPSAHATPTRPSRRDRGSRTDDLWRRRKYPIASPACPAPMTTTSTASRVPPPVDSSVEPITAAIPALRPAKPAFTSGGRTDSQPASQCPAKVRPRPSGIRTPGMRGFSSKRMKGLEPSTFCMAKDGACTDSDGPEPTNRITVRIGLRPYDRGASNRQPNLATNLASLGCAQDPELPIPRRRDSGCTIGQCSACCSPNSSTKRRKPASS